MSPTARRAQRRARRLRWELAANYAALTLIITALLTTLSLRIVAGVLIKTSEQQALAAIHSITTSLNEALENPFADLAHTLQSQSYGTDGRLLWLNPDGSVRLDTCSKEKLGGTCPNIPLELLDTPTPLAHIYEGEETWVIYAAAPISGPMGTSGSALLARDAGALQNNLRELRRVLWLLGAGLSALFAFLGFFYARSTAKPWEELTLPAEMPNNASLSTRTQLLGSHSLRLLLVPVALFLALLLFQATPLPKLPTSSLNLSRCSDERKPVQAEQTLPIPPVTAPVMDLAFVSEGFIYATDAELENYPALSDSGQAVAPNWSYDGEWLAYLRVTDPYDSEWGDLWLVRRDGTLEHQVQGLPAAVHREHFAWAPGEDCLLVAVHDHGLWLVPPSGEPEQLDEAPWLHRAAWSPSGRYIAYNYCINEGKGTALEGDDDILVIFDMKTKERHELLRTDDAGIRVFGWWPDGKGLLYWEVAGHGGSVATDGVPLMSVALRFSATGSPKAAASPTSLLDRRNINGPQPVELATTLVHPQWVKLGTSRDLLLVAGGGRISWANKQLLLADVETGQVEPIAGPPNTVALDPDVFLPEESILFVAAPDLGFDRWGLTEEEYTTWLEQRSLWVRESNGTLREISGAGNGIFTPTWSKDGKHIRYLAHDALWSIAADNSEPPVKIADLGPGEHGGLYLAQEPGSRLAWYDPNCGLNDLDVPDDNLPQILGIGDSVLDMVAQSVIDCLPDSVFDTKIARQISQGVEILASHLEEQIPDIILISLGTNGNFHPQVLDEYRRLAGDIPLVFMNTYMPDSWQESVNSKLAAYTAEHPNTYLIDWHALAEPHPEWFYSDGYHPKPPGARQLTELIVEVLRSIWQSDAADLTVAPEPW